MIGALLFLILAALLFPRALKILFAVILVVLLNMAANAIH